MPIQLDVVTLERSVYSADDGNAAIRCYDPAGGTVGTVLGRGRGAESVTVQELYNLDDDLGESRDVAADHPSVVAASRIPVTLTFLDQ